MPAKGVRTWTDDDLRAAVASSQTYAEVLRKLGLPVVARNYRRVQERLLAMGVARTRAARGFTDDALRAAVPACHSYIGVVEVLGLERTDTNATRVKRRIAVLGLDTKHFMRRRDASGRATRWTEDALREAVVSSRSVAGVLRTLGLVPAGGNYRAVQERISRLSLDTSHFTGKAWNVGGNHVPRPARALAEVLVAGQATNSHKLKQRLIRAGLKHAACERCGWAERAADGRVPLELDHRNGDPRDNRLENLTVLCPNCHALQPTHRGLNRRRCGERDSNPQE